MVLISSNKRPCLNFALILSYLGLGNSVADFDCFNNDGAGGLGGWR